LDKTSILKRDDYMDFPKWAEEDGKKLADLIIEALSKQNTLRVDEIMDIYDNSGIAVLRKTEGVTWRILNPHIERVRDENNRMVIKLKEETL
jgi:hypothetical protein